MTTPPPIAYAGGSHVTPDRVTTAFELPKGRIARNLGVVRGITVLAYGTAVVVEAS